MSNFFKKVTSTVSVVAIVASAMSSTLVANAASQFAPYADALATAGIISKQTTEAGYNLGNNVTRAEMAKVAVNIKKAEVKECTGTVFSDVTATLGDLCGYVEAAAEAGLVNKTAAKFRPMDLVTRAEMLKMLLGAQGIAPTDEDQGFTDLGSDASLNGYINAAAKAGIINKGTSFNPTNNASRGEAFKVAANSTGLTTSAVEGTTGDDLDLGDLFGDDTGTGTTDTTSTGTTTTVKAGDLEIGLAASSPASTTLPANVSGVVVAKFDFTAGSADISVNSVKLKRVGLGDSDTLAALALSTADGRISKSKNENSSDDTVDFALSSTMVVKAGSTVTVNVLATVPVAATAGNDEFAIQVVSVGSSAANVTMGTVTSNTMKVGSVDAAGLTVADDGTTAAVKVGETSKEVYKFKITNGSNDEDMTLSSLTLKETGTADDMVDFANWKLLMDGTEVATTAKSSDKYVTFNMSAVTLKASKIHKFVVKADVMGGAGKNVLLSLDSTLDVTAQGTKYGYGVGVTDSSAGAAVSIGAGELVLGAIDATSTTIKEDKNDVILGKIKVTSNAGKNLELQKFRVSIANSHASNVSVYMENVELYDETNGTVYDLTSGGAAQTETFSDADLNIALPSTGSVTFAIRADTKNLAGGDLTNFAASRFTPSVAVGDPGFYVVETEDDTAVSDITPSSMSFKVIAGSTATATTSIVPLSATKSSVIGSTDVEALAFEIKADDSSDLKVSEIKVKNAAAATLMNSANVSEVKLYKGSISDANLLDRVSGSQITTSSATFDGFSVAIAKNATQKFVVTVSLVDDSTNNAETLNLGLLDANIDDEDNDDVAVDYDSNDDGEMDAAYTSARTITIKGAGSLKVAVDTTDSEVDKTKNVIGNTTSPFVASYELTAVNEGILVKDVVVTASHADFPIAVSEIVLYKGDKTTEIARKTVTATATTFDNINYTVAEGTDNMYVKVVTRKIGKDEAGKQSADITLHVTITEAEGADSNKVLTADNANSTVDAQEVVYDELGEGGNAAGTFDEATDDDSGESLAFKVVPTRVSNVAFVDSASGITRATKLNSGVNNVAIIAVTTDSSTNSNVNGGTLKTNLKSVKVNVAKLTSAAGTIVTGMTIEKVNGTEGTVAGTLLNGAAGATFGANDTPVSATFDTSSLTADDLIDNGTTVYYVVKATVTKDATVDNDDYVKVSFDALNSSQIVYTADSAITGLADVTDLRIGLTKIDGTQINE